MVQLDLELGRVYTFEPLGVPVQRPHLPMLLASFERKPVALFRGGRRQEIPAEMDLGLQLTPQDLLPLLLGGVGLDLVPIPYGGVEIAAHVDQRAVGLFGEPVFQPSADLFRGRLEVVGEPDDAVGPPAKPRREHSPGEDGVPGLLEQPGQHAGAVHA